MRIASLIAVAALTVAQPALSQPREGFVTADDGTKLFYKVEGSGPDVVMVVHGGPGGSLESVRPDFGRLAKGRTVIYYDQRGNGRSDLIDDESRVGINYQVADLDSVRRHFKIKKLTLLGNSWGGFLIAAYAAAHPDKVDRLVLDVPAPPRLGQLEQMAQEIDRRVEQRMNEEDRQRLGRLYRAWQESADPVPSCKAFYQAILLAYAHDPSRVPQLKGDLCNGRPEALRRQQLVNQAIWRSLGKFDYRPAVRTVTSPVLIIHGVSDVIPVEGSKDWARNFPNSRLLLVEGAGHVVHVEQPDTFFGAVDRFLKGEWPAGAAKLDR